MPAKPLRILFGMYLILAVVQRPSLLSLVRPSPLFSFYSTVFLALPTSLLTAQNHERMVVVDVVRERAGEARIIPYFQASLRTQRAYHQ